MKRLLFICAAVALSSCASLPKPSPRAAVYDFGLPSGKPTMHLNVSFAGITIAPGLDTTDIRYRLVYKIPSQVYAYTESRWAEPISKLFVSRLRQRVDFSPTAPCTLHVELQSFDQVFDSPQSSHAVIQLTVDQSQGRTTNSRQTIRIEQAADSADAHGGIAALISATDKAIDQLAALATSPACQP